MDFQRDAGSQEGCEQRSNKRYVTLSGLGALPQQDRNTAHCTEALWEWREIAKIWNAQSRAWHKARSQDTFPLFFVLFHWLRENSRGGEKRLEWTGGLTHRSHLLKRIYRTATEKGSHTSFWCSGVAWRKVLSPAWPQGLRLPVEARPQPQDWHTHPSPRISMPQAQAGTPRVRSICLSSAQCQVS